MYKNTRFSFKSTNIVLVLCLLSPAIGTADTQDNAKAEFDRLATKIGRSTLAADLTQAGSYYLGASQSVTVDDLRGVDIDDNPPSFAFQPNYPTIHADGVPANTQPYRTAGIKPFRFAYFNNEWNYQGWHTWQMSDYGLLNGFNISGLYANRAIASVPVAGTQFLQWSGLNWDSWMSAHGYNFRRWDQLPTRDAVATTLLGENLFPYQAGVTYRMLDMESPSSPYTQSNLQAESWYPGPAPNIEFERQYYAGFATTQVAASETAKRQGWPKVGIYGWQPFPRTWFGLENVVLDPTLDWRWNTYGKSIYLNPNLDLLYPSVYSFYWDERNVAYTLATIDLNTRLVNSEAVRKPVRPYFWHQLHGGGSGWRWWAGQPQRNEDMQAMIALTFFTGVDGLTLWGWSGTGNPNSVSLLEGRDYTVGAGFMLAPEDVTKWGSNTKQFVRYDAIHVLDVDTSGTARFQLINKSKSPYDVDKGWQPGAQATYPIYAVPASQLSANLRPDSEPVAAVIEGLALAKPFEYALRNGEVKIDVSAQAQFKDNSPIVRRVKIGRYHLLATYDPAWQRGGTQRSVTLTDFDGVPGLNLTLLADNKTRFYAVETHSADLVVTATTTKDPIVIGQPVAYSLMVGNNGPALATAVKFVDVLPVGMSFVSANASPGSCSGTTTITCELGSVASGSSATVTIVAKANSSGIYTNSASISAAEHDPNPTDNSITTPVSVLGSCIKASGFKIIGKTELTNKSILSGVALTLLGSNCGDRTTTNSEGRYEFSKLSEGNFSVTPMMMDCTSFTPSSRNYTPLSSNEPGQTYTGTCQ